jgi:hypothetical protein
MTDKQAVFLNDDGSVATWVEEISSKARFRTFLFKAAFGVIPAILIIYGQFREPSVDDGLVLIAGLLCLGGLYFGAKAQTVSLRRCYSYEEVRVSFAERLKESWMLLVAGGVLALMIVLSQSKEGEALQEDTYWALLFVAGPFLFYGLFKLLKSKRLALTSGATKARTFFGDGIESIDVQKEKSSMSPQTEKLFDVVDGIFEWLGKAFTSAVGIILGLIFIVGIGWLIFAGVSQLPVSVAIIIGALIIAMAVRR